jgi:hypothetical protein
MPAEKSSSITRDREQGHLLVPLLAAASDGW